MSEEIENGEVESEDVNEVENEEPEQQEENGRVRSIQHLSGMFEKWFLDYASYVILERAVPYVNDGLKPVQRRILHAMKEMDDGRFNKVANIVGSTMAYHPHGDASIKDALVQLGQKNLLVDCQGNWGNILTGDDAAAGRYIEARLSKFALDVVFNKKTTEWMLSYDGRKEEPVTLPIKFPLLLAQAPLTGLQDLIGSVPHTPADPQGAVVPEIAADLPHDHGNAIGGEPHRLTDVKVVDGLDEPDAPNLKQVVHVLAEEVKNGWYEGLTDEYIRVTIRSEGVERGIMYPVHITAITEEGMAGKIENQELEIRN